MIYSKKEFFMWTDIIITILSDNNALEDIYNSFWIFYSFEKEFSRFLESSDLTKLNKTKECELSNRFIEIFKLSKKINIDTNWFFNPLINLNNIWYSKDFMQWIFEKKDEKNDLDLNKVSIIWNFISLKDNQNLDLWWIVKWYCVDYVSNYLKEKWYKNFIVNAGWDVYLSWYNSTWKIPIVAINNPFDKEKIFATLELKDASISTSWTYKRKWNIDNKNYHHIINPFIQKNLDEIISISLISDNCYISDSYATACIAMWIEKSLKFLSEKNIDWVIIWSDSKIYQTKWLSKYNFKII